MKTLLNTSQAETCRHIASHRNGPGSSSLGVDSSVLRQISNRIGSFQPNAYLVTNESPAIDAANVNPMGSKATKPADHWTTAPKFGPFYHFQRWRLVT